MTQHESYDMTFKHIVVKFLSPAWIPADMETFSALLALCAMNSKRNSPHKGQWRGALMFSLIRVLNKRLCKQSWGWWFETPSRSLWRHCNDSRQRPTWLWCRKSDTISTIYVLNCFEQNNSVFSFSFFLTMTRWKKWNRSFQETWAYLI